MPQIRVGRLEVWSKVGEISISVFSVPLRCPWEVAGKGPAPYCWAVSAWGFNRSFDVALVTQCGEKCLRVLSDHSISERLLALSHEGWEKSPFTNEIYFSVSIDLRHLLQSLAQERLFYFPSFNEVLSVQCWSSWAGCLVFCVHLSVFSVAQVSATKEAQSWCTYFKDRSHILWFSLWLRIKTSHLVGKSPRKVSGKCSDLTLLCQLV